MRKIRDKVVSMIKTEQGMVAVTERGFVFWSAGNITKWTPNGKEYKTLWEWMQK